MIYTLKGEHEQSNSKLFTWECPSAFKVRYMRFVNPHDEEMFISGVNQWNPDASNSKINIGLSVRSRFTSSSNSKIKTSRSQ